MQHAGVSMGGSELALLRIREDGVRARLVALRERLAACVPLASTFETHEGRLDNPQSAPYRTEDVAGNYAKAREARVLRSELRTAEAELMRELEAIRARLALRGIRRVTLPLLDNVDIAAPCHVSWADMQGDTDVRFCSSCKKNVFNLSMMSKEEAEAVLGIAKSDNAELCVRLFRRADGTVLTQDCPIGLQRQRFWRRTAGIAAAGLLLAALGAVAYSQLTCQTHIGGATSGAAKAAKTF